MWIQVDLCFGEYTCELFLIRSVALAAEFPSEIFMLVFLLMTHIKEKREALNVARFTVRGSGIARMSKRATPKAPR